MYHSNSLKKMAHSSDTKLGPLQHILAASFGGVITSLAVSPLDVVKTRLQSQINYHNQPILAYKNTIDAFTKITRNEGILTLWRGIGPSIAMTVPATAIYFALYEKLNNYWWSSLGYFTPMVAGSSARLFTTTLTLPIELIRTYQQSNKIKINSMEIIRKIIREKGIIHMWMGLSPTLWRDVPFSGIYWSSFEFLKAILKSYDRSPFLVNFISGAISGMIAATLTLPFDVMKTRQQMIIDKYHQKTPMRELFKKIIREEGYRGLLKGGFPRAIRVAPACAIMISCYELIKGIIKQYQ